MRDPLRQRRLGFAFLLLLQAGVYGYLILNRRLPRGHDTLSVFLLQYLFLAHSAPGSGMLWMPYLAHGVPSTWFANAQAGLLQNVLLLAGGVPAGTPLLPIFYAGLFIEDLILLIGVWRLGGRFYQTPSAQFFVALAALGSSMWVSNIFWNHRLIYAVPLILSLLLDVLETGSRGRLFLALSLLCLQFMGAPPYIPVLSGLAIGVFLALHIVLHRKRLRNSLPLFRLRARDALWLAALAIPVASVLIAMLQGLGSIRQYTAGRAPDGSVRLDAFLTFPGSLNPLRYLDLLPGITPSKDYSVYCGICTVLLAFFALVIRPGKNVVLLGVSGLLLLLFSMGYLSIVGMASYDAVYPLHFFRYVSLAAPLVKLHLILLSGFGFDALARPREGRNFTLRPVAFAVLAGGVLGGQLLYLKVRGGDPSDGVAAFFRQTLDGLEARESRPPGTPGLLLGAAAAAGAVAVAIASRSRPGAERWLLPLLLVLHGSDVFRWRCQMFVDETVPLGEPAYAVQEIRPMPYIARRSAGIESSRRYLDFGRNIFESGATSGVLYDYGDAFLHRDASGSRFRVTQWSASVDLLLRARAGRRLDDGKDSPPFFSSDPAGLRTLPEAYGKVIGEREDKLQVFSAAHVASSDQETAEFMSRPEFGGDVLLLAPGVDGKEGSLDPSFLGRNERVESTPKVLEFAADRIRVEVELPAPRSEAWLVYADAWHPDWKAAVDGFPATLHRANLAYKAVRLHAGRNVVEFRFSAPLRSLTRGVVGLLSLFWCGVLGAWTVTLLARRPPPALRSAAA